MHISDDLQAIDLNDLSDRQIGLLRRLNVTKHQEKLGKSFPESLTDWRAAAAETVLGLAFLLDGAPVGIVLFRRSGTTATIHGLKIALPWQGRGLGHRAFRLGIAHLKASWPEVRQLKLSVDAENAPALAIYRAAGMTDSGPVDGGPNGPQHHMDLWV